MQVLAIVSESSYPGGGGEEFLYDIALFFNNYGFKVIWFTFHNWGMEKHKVYKTISRKNYIEIQINNRNIDYLSNYDYLKGAFKKYRVDYIFHQGRGHKLICDVGFSMNYPTITQWCFWEEAIEINSKYGLVDINKNISHHNENENFKYIINTIDHFYFASQFVKNTIENKYSISLSNKNVFPTLCNNKRSKKNPHINSLNSKYISLLDAHSLKGGLLFAELIVKNPFLCFLAIKTEDEGDGPNAIIQAMRNVNNKDNIFLKKRVNNIKEVYNKTKILLCPTYLDETFCRVVFEAFMNKIPVIFSDKGNLGLLRNKNLLMVEDFDVIKYNNYINKLISNDAFYKKIVDLQFNCYIEMRKLADFNIIYKKFQEIEMAKEKRIGIFTPWCDQGLGIQSRIYKKILEEMGYKVFIFATKPYLQTNVCNLINKTNEWKTDGIYRSPNKRLEITNLELDLFVENYKIKKFIIPEIQFERIFEIANYLKEKYKVSTYAIPNIECIREHELKKFAVFEKVLVNNMMSYKILKKYGINNLEYLGFGYDVTNALNVSNIMVKKQVDKKIKILHLSGLNGLFRKRTDVIIEIFHDIYNEGFTDFELNIAIQGNFDLDKYQIFNEPFINLINQHLSYTEILDLYNENHISIQLSKHEGLGLGFYESCYMNTPVITLDAPPHNEIIHHNKNGWLLSCYIEKDASPENPYTIIGQTQIDKKVIKKEILSILKTPTNINNIIKLTKTYFESIHGVDKFKKNIMKVFNNN